MRIVMMGTGTFAEPTFETLLAAGETVVGLVTQPEWDAGRKGGATRQTGKGMAAIAQDAGVPVLQPESINTPDGLAALRALEPDLMLLDEPTQGMGHEDVHRVTELIKKVSAGRTILMVEHNMNVVSSIADRITVLQRGAVIADGPYSEVSKNPQVIEAYMGASDAELQGAH